MPLYLVTLTVLYSMSNFTISHAVLEHDLQKLLLHRQIYALRLEILLTYMYDCTCGPGCQTSWMRAYIHAKYGSHWCTVLSSSRVCKYCAIRRPALLEEQAFSVILKDPELLKKTCSTLSHLPLRLSCLIGHAINTHWVEEAAQLVEFVHEDKSQLSWFCADSSHSIVKLLRFRFCCKVYKKLKPFMECPSKGIAEILQYIYNFRKKYKDFWSSMNSAMKTLKTEIDLGVFKDIAFTDENNAVPVNLLELNGGYRLSTKRATGEYESMKELQKLSKTAALPVVFQATSIQHESLESHEIPNLLANINQQLISKVYLTNASSWSVGDINALEDVLSACNNLSCLYLAQKRDNTDIADDAIEAIFRMLGKHPQISEIGFEGMTLGGALGKYPLPAVESLCLECCMLREPGFEGISKLNLKYLEVTYMYNLPNNNFHGLYQFIEEQAQSLERLGLDFHLLAQFEYINLLKQMTKFDRLQKLYLICIFHVDISCLENILLAFMCIRSAKSLTIDSVPRLDEDELQSRMTHLLQAMKSSCTLNCRPPLHIKLIQGGGQSYSTLKTVWRY